MYFELAPGVRIPEDACAFQAVRASGPGGQNVNKVATKVILRLPVDRIEGLSAEARERLRAIAGKRWLEGDILQVAASDARNQLENRQRAEARLFDLIRSALDEPRKRRPTRPTYSSVVRRVESKRVRSTLKRARRERPDVD